MEHDLELQMLDLQAAGIKLYADLAEFYHWLSEPRMERTLWNKLQEAVDNNLSTRFQLIDRYGGIIQKPPEKNMSGAKDKKTGKVTQLQWQEGTDEPEDEPNISNGIDTMPKKPPTRQPWEQPILPGQSFMSAPKKEDIDRLYNEGLRRWLAYEKAAVDLYQQIPPADGWYEDLLLSAEKEVECLEESLGIRK